MEKVENPDKYHDAMQKFEYKCKRCGHTVTIIAAKEKNLCDWCGHYVFKDDKTEFKYRMKTMLRRNK